MKANKNWATTVPDTLIKLLERVVCEFDVKVGELFSGDNSKRILEARDACIRSLRFEHEMTLEAIGRVFSISHCTVHGIVKRANAHNHEHNKDPRYYSFHSAVRRSNIREYAE